MSRDSSTALGMTGHWSLVRQFSLDASLSFTSSQNRAPHRLYLPCRHVFRRFAVVPRMHPSSRTRYHHPGVPIAMAESMQSFTTTLDELERRLHEIDHMMGDPAIATDAEKLMELGRERSEIEPLVAAWNDYKSTETQIDEARLMVDDNDPDLADLAEQELKTLRQHRDELETTIRRLLVPKDPNDEKNVIVEIRAGTGGDEAALFAADLFRMYSRYAEDMRWKTEVLS